MLPIETLTIRSLAPLQLALAEQYDGVVATQEIAACQPAPVVTLSE
jgi:hypothetical protein